MGDDAERLLKKDLKRASRLALGPWWMAMFVVPISIIASMFAVSLLGSWGVIPRGPRLVSYVQIAHLPVLVLVIAMQYRRRGRWIRRVYEVDGRVCLMCGYTLLAEHDGQPCPECGAKADLARYRRLWIEFAGGWKQWPAELKKSAAKTPPEAEG